VMDYRLNGQCLIPSDDIIVFYFAVMFRRNGDHPPMGMSKYFLGIKTARAKN
jgi:hypothetical protein